MFRVTRCVGIITEIFKHVNYHLGLMLFTHYIEVITTECAVHIFFTFFHITIYIQSGTATVIIHTDLIWNLKFGSLFRALKTPL
jgi:hypothetical protein